MKILVTGGLGFIGSHTVIDLLNNDFEVVIIDNLVNCDISVSDKIKAITKKDFKLYVGDVCDKELLRKIFKDEKINAIIHFAGYKAVGESVLKPIMYYRNNIDSTLTLLEVMKEYGVKNIIFSSSATVYGNPKILPIKEDFPLSTTNPYGTTKLMIETILKDLYKSDSSYNIILLRYFNPIGAHKSGLLGESPNGIPNNLMPYILRVATKKYPYLHVYGNDYKTVDGTGVRDYIHVMDLAEGHVLACKYLSKNKGLSIFNLGTGHGTSVLELVSAFEKATGVKVPYKIEERRAGDIDSCYADISQAKKELGFKAKYTISDCCTDGYKFILKNME